MYLNFKYFIHLQNYLKFNLTNKKSFKTQSTELGKNNGLITAIS